MDPEPWAPVFARLRRGSEARRRPPAPRKCLRRAVPGPGPRGRRPDPHPRGGLRAREEGRQRHRPLQPRDQARPEKAGRDAGPARIRRRGPESRAGSTGHLTHHAPVVRLAHAPVRAEDRARSEDRLPDGAARRRPDSDRSIRCVSLARGIRYRRPRRLRAAPREGGRRRDLVALLSRPDARVPGGGPRPWPFGRSLDGEPRGGHGVVDRTGGRWAHHRSAGPGRAAMERRKLALPASTPVLP